LPSSHESMAEFKVGDRVKAKMKDAEGVGTIKFIGDTEFQPGEWVGVALYEPIGKNAGSVQGKKYFECKPKHGTFVKRGALTSENAAPASPAKAPKEEITELVTAISKQVLADIEWKNEDAPGLAAEIQAKTFEAVKKPGYKVVVMAEVRAPNTGMAKSLMTLFAPDDIYVEVEVASPAGLMAYVLICLVKYTNAQSSTSYSGWGAITKK